MRGLFSVAGAEVLNGGVDRGADLGFERIGRREGIVGGVSTGEQWGEFDVDEQLGAGDVWVGGQVGADAFAGALFVVGVFGGGGVDADEAGYVLFIS